MSKKWKDEIQWGHCPCDKDVDENDVEYPDLSLDGSYEYGECHHCGAKWTIDVEEFSRLYEEIEMKYIEQEFSSIDAYLNARQNLEMYHWFPVASIDEEGDDS